LFSDAAVKRVLNEGKEELGDERNWIDPPYLKLLLHDPTPYSMLHNLLQASSSMLYAHPRLSGG
jgi:hypothetical protein